MIRKAKLNDMGAILELWDQFIMDHDKIVFREKPSFRPYLKIKKNGRSIVEEFYKKHIRSKNGQVFIAEDKGKPIGYCLVYIDNNIPVFELEKLGYISDMFLLKEYRRKGISSLFFKESKKWCKKKGLKYMSINVNSVNSVARKVYRSWGFEDQRIEMRMRV
ncbi:GNAT family N-acetyltransferase [Nanoarchaeota archaeon]